MASTNRDMVLKVVVLGEPGVGKTSLLRQFVNNEATANVDILTKRIYVEDQALTLQIWDTAGQERFHSLSVSHARGAHCCILVYDVTDSASFRKLDSWYDMFLIQAGPRKSVNFPFVVIGNKIDRDNRQVSTKRAMDWCAHRDDLPYFETSAKNSINVEQAFKAVAHSALAAELAVSASSNSITLDPQNRDSLSLERNDLTASQSRRRCC